MLAFKLTAWYGTLPEWFAAIGTVGAFIGGLRLFRREQEDRRLAQPRQVSAWATEPEPREPPSLDSEFAVVVKNSSSEPAQVVFIGLAGSAISESWETTLPILPPGVEREVVRLPAGPYWPGLVTISFGLLGRRWTRRADGVVELERGPRRSIKDRLDACAKGQVDELDTT